MDGEVLRDAGGVESAGVRETAGMGLLPLCTDFQEEKVRTQVEGPQGAGRRPGPVVRPMHQWL